MLIKILSFAHNLTTLLFGIFISAFFLGVRQNKKNTFILSLFFCFEGLIYIFSFMLFGEKVTNQLYAVIVHLPLVLFLILYYKYQVISSFISVFSAYLCCQLSNWIGLLILTITDMEWCYYISRILTTLITFILLCRLVCRTTEAVFAKDTRELAIIGFLPSTYYISDYVFTKLSGLLYSGSKTVAEFMGFIFCLSYLAFLFVYFREYERKQEISQYSSLMEMQLFAIKKEIDQVKRTQHSLAILRHDMRHHLNIILTQIQNNHIEQAADYIRIIGNTYDDTVITIYCRNEMLNSVISVYQARFTENGISFHHDITVDDLLHCPDTTICTILSNALENALNAFNESDSDNKWVRLMISQKGNHLLFQIENPVQQIPRFADGIPVSERKGHGIGVKSIVYYTEQLGGQCQFNVSGNTFILRIII